MTRALERATDPKSAWERAARSARDRYDQRVQAMAGCWVGAATALVLCLLVPGIALGAVAASFAAAGGALTAGVLRANRGPRRALRESYDAWLRATTDAEAFREAARALAAARRRGPHDAEKTLAAARDAGVQLSAETLAELERAAEAELREQSALAREIEAQRKALVKLRDTVAQHEAAVAAARVRERVALDAASDAVAEAEVRRRELLALSTLGTAPGPSSAAVQYPHPGQAPALEAGASVEALRREVESAQEAAERGVVVESALVGAIVSEPARWSPYAAPLHLTKELLALFEPGAHPTAAVSPARDAHTECPTRAADATGATCATSTTCDTSDTGATPGGEPERS